MDENHEAEAVLARAQARAKVRAELVEPIDYGGVKQVFPRQKAALTRAINSGDPNKVVLACRDAVRAWGQPPFNGAWPDDWSRWQRALDDALGYQRTVRLEDL